MKGGTEKFSGFTNLTEIAKNSQTGYIIWPIAIAPNAQARYTAAQNSSQRHHRDLQIQSNIVDILKRTAQDQSPPS